MAVEKAEVARATGNRNALALRAVKPAPRLIVIRGAAIPSGKPLVLHWSQPAACLVCGRRGGLRVLRGETVPDIGLKHDLTSLQGVP